MPRIRHFDETRFDFRVIDFIEFDVLGKPTNAVTVLEANHVNSGVYARGCSIAALGDRGISKKILVCARFHPRLPEVRLKEQASQDTRVRDACDRPTTGTSRVVRGGGIHDGEGAVSPHPSAAGERAV